MNQYSRQWCLITQKSDLEGRGWVWTSRKSTWAIGGSFLRKFSIQAGVKCEKNPPNKPNPSKFNTSDLFFKIGCFLLAPWIISSTTGQSHFSPLIIRKNSLSKFHCHHRLYYQLLAPSTSIAGTHFSHLNPCGFSFSVSSSYSKWRRVYHPQRGEMTHLSNFLTIQ